MVIEIGTWLAVAEIISAMAMAEPVFSGIQKRLGKDPITNSIRDSLIVAYKATLEKYPELSSELFDPLFLEKFGTEVIGKTLLRNEQPTGKELALAWVGSIGAQKIDKVDYIIPVCELFLQEFEAELKRQHELREYFNSKALEITAYSTAHIAENTARISEKLESLNVFVESTKFPRKSSYPIKTSPPVPEQKR